MELWDLYNKDRQLVGKTHERGVSLDDGYYHLVVEIITMNQNKQILLTKRDKQKTYSGLWECTSGSVIAGEDSFHGAKRELYEETGIIVEDVYIKKIDSVICDSTQSIFDIYMAYSKASINDLVLQEGETVEAKWVNLSELTAMFQAGTVIPNVYYNVTKYKEELNKFIHTC